MGTTRMVRGIGTAPAVASQGQERLRHHHKQVPQTIHQKDSQCVSGQVSEVALQVHFYLEHDILRSESE